MPDPRHRILFMQASVHALEAFSTFAKSADDPAERVAAEQHRAGIANLASKYDAAGPRGKVGIIAIIAEGLSHFGDMTSRRAIQFPDIEGINTTARLATAALALLAQALGSLIGADALKAFGGLVNDPDDADRGEAEPRQTRRIAAWIRPSTASGLTALPRQHSTSIMVNSAAARATGGTSAASNCAATISRCCGGHSGALASRTQQSRSDRARTRYSSVGRPSLVIAFRSA